MNTENPNPDNSSFKVKNCLKKVVEKVASTKFVRRLSAAMTPGIAEGVVDEGSQKKEAIKSRLILFPAVLVPAIIAGMYYLVRQSDEAKFILEGTSALAVVGEAYLIQVTRKISKETRSSKTQSK